MHTRHWLLLLCGWMATLTAGWSQSQEVQSDILINEIQVANIDCFLDPSFNYGGWVELYNTTSTPIPLTGITLRHTDSEGKIETQKLSAQHGTILPRGFLNLWFDHNSRDGYYGGDAYYQIPFKLDDEGGVIELLDGAGVLMDAINYPAGVSRCSWARRTDGGPTWGYTSQPTPAVTNNMCRFANERLPAPEPDGEGGVFDDETSFRVQIPTGATLYYTTDGSIPMAGASDMSATGVFRVSKTANYRLMFVQDEFLNSPVVTRSYVKRDYPYYLPIVSLSTHPDNFFDPTIGLYVVGTNGRAGNNKSFPCNQNMDWERPVNVEYFVPDASGNYHERLNQGADFSIFGGWTRFNDGDDFFEYKSSFKLKADKTSGSLNHFPYPVFDSKPYVKLKHLLVRNGGQDQYARIWDAAIQELIRTSGMYVDCQAWQPAHVFLDGHFLGTFNLREASNRKFAYSNYGIDDDEIDQFEGEFTMKAGDNQIFNRWYTLSRELAANPDDEEVWQAICEILDVDEYCNYMAAETYMGNLDWLRGGLKNIKGFCAKSDDGKIHIVLFDVDGGFGDTNMIEQILNNGTGKLPLIFKNMLKHESFKKQFVDAYCLMGGSVFEPNRALPIIRSMAATTNPALQWEGNDNTEKTERLCSRLSDRTNHHEKRIASLKKALSLDSGYKLKISASSPHARLLLNGQEIPAEQFDGTLFAPILLTATAPGGLALTGWEVDGAIVCTDSLLDFSSRYQAGTHTVKAVYESVSDPVNMPPVRINEVCASNDIYISDLLKKSDWLEIYNTTSSPVDVAGMFLSDNPQQPRKYQLPQTAPIFIPPHSHRVVWCDNRETVLADDGSVVSLHAPFKLKNADGASVSIQAKNGSWTDRLYYSMQGRWQSFGRYPDGNDHVALFDRITIEQTNRVNTHTAVYQPATVDEGTAIRPVLASEDQPTVLSRHLVAVHYFNLSGQQIQSPRDAAIVVQKLVYDDGSTLVRKVMNR